MPAGEREGERKSEDMAESGILQVWEACCVVFLLWGAQPLSPLLSVFSLHRLGGSCKYIQQLLLHLMLQLLRHPLAAAAPGWALSLPCNHLCILQTDWSQRKPGWGPRLALHLDPSPFHVLTPFCLASHHGLGNPRDPLLLPSPERVLTPEALRSYHISVPIQNCRMLHHRQFPSPYYFLLFCTLRMGAHLWPLQCLVLAAETLRRIINHSMWTGPKLQETGTLIRCFQEGHGPADLGWNLISYLLELVQVQRWTMDTLGEGQLPSSRRVVVGSLEKPGWDVTQKIMKSSEALWCNWSSVNFNQGMLMVTALAFVD